MTLKQPGLGSDPSNELSWERGATTRTFKYHYGGSITSLCYEYVIEMGPPMSR